MLQEDVKTRIRVHLGVPVLGTVNLGASNVGFRFTAEIGNLEYRMNALQPFEEASITGTPAGSAILTGTPIAGDVLTLTVQSAAAGSQPIALTYTVTANDVAASDDLSAIAAALVNAIASNDLLAAIVTAGYAPTKTIPMPNAVAPNASLILQSVDGNAFSIATTFSGGAIFVPYAQGKLPSPTATFKEDGVTLYGYVPICDYLEGKTAGASDLLKFSRADVVTFRSDELQARARVYQYWRKRLASFLGIPMYPTSPGGFGGRGTGLTV